MKELCSDSTRPEFHAPSLNTNYIQMKVDNPKSHSKVFVDDGYQVTIWDEVKPKLDEYVEYFAVDLDETTASGKDQSVISRHINSAFKEGEVDRKSNMQNLHIASSYSPVFFYNLDGNKRIAATMFL